VSYRKPTRREIRSAIERLAEMLEKGVERPFDLRREDGPTVWPLLLACAGGREDVASDTCLTLERLNAPRGGFFLPWSRRQSGAALGCALRSALESLCECGALLPDPEDATYCEECAVDQQSVSLERRAEMERK